MCGLFGFSKRTPATEAMMPFLAWEMVGRGRDSWGVTDGVSVLKRLGAATESWEVPKWGEALVFHTRAASVGDKTIDNQHPFTFNELDEDGNPTGAYIIGAHNGGISNHTELATKYSRKFAVDSMHVFAHLAEGKETGELSGYGAFIWFRVEPDGGKRLRFAKANMSDLHVFELEDGGVVFCSLASPIEKACKMLDVRGTEVMLADETQYTVVVGEDGRGKHSVQRETEFKFGQRYKNYSRGSLGSGGYGSEFVSYGGGGFCKVCSRTPSYCICKDKDKIKDTDAAKMLEIYNNPQWQRVLENHVRIEKKGGAGAECERCKKKTAIAGRMLLCDDCLIHYIVEFEEEAGSCEFG